MPQQIEVSVNQQVLLTFDSQPRLAGKQRQFLDNMDDDMDKGIDLAGESCKNPSDLEKAQYVAMRLMQGLDAEDKSLVSICCAYLGHRYPDLTVIKAKMHKDEIQMELLFK